MVATDSIEGLIDNTLWFHYDMINDVLYLRVESKRDIATYADEQPDGMLRLLTQDDDELVGLTIVNWWKLYGVGKTPDSLRDLEDSIEPFARKLAA